MDLSFSITMVVWAAVGGRNSILGACIGAILINMIEAGMSETQALVESWRAIIGVIFIVVVLFLPRGLAGLANDALDNLLGRSGKGGAPGAGRRRRARQIQVTGKGNL